MKITVLDHEGVAHIIAAEQGMTLMQVIRNQDMDLLATCGGSCACGTCHVYIHEEWLPKLELKSEVEAELLELSSVAKTMSRLACQINLTEELNGLSVALTADTI